MKSFHITATQNLPEHDRVLRAILEFFRAVPGAVGCFLSGSVAANQMDEDSDLDIGIVFQTAEQRESIWQKRWNWEIASWFHRFDADHIKPHFVIYLYEPNIKADINLYLEGELPRIEGGPYSLSVVWDATASSVLTAWVESLAKQTSHEPDWRPVAHEDERFWAWMFYLYAHVHRGEYYHAASEFPVLRDILEQWTARLAGQSPFTSRRMERAVWAQRLLGYDLFPKPVKDSLKASMLNAIKVQLALRREVEDQVEPTWKTQADAMEKISSLIQGL